MASFKPSWLLYGATGYQGRLIAEEARARGHNVILGGRHAAALAPLSGHFGVGHRVCDMAHRDQIDRALTGVRLVLNCAGPFSLTASTLAQACLRTGTHYLDIADGIVEHRALQRLDERAQAAEVMLMPGVGYGILPSDCLAVHLKERMPEAQSLLLAFDPGPGASHGTLATLMESLQTNGWVRRKGELVAAQPASSSRTLDFGHGLKRRAVLYPWRADVLAASLSTDIPSIESYAAVGPMLRVLLKRRRWAAAGPLKTLLEGYVSKAPPGPSPAQRKKRRSWLFGQASGAGGTRAWTIIEGPNPYDFTTHSALLAVEHCLAGRLPAGYRSPAQLLGAAPLKSLPDLNLFDL